MSKELTARVDALEKAVTESVGTRLEEQRERIDTLEKVVLDLRTRIDALTSTPAPGPETPPDEPEPVETPVDSPNEGARESRPPARGRHGKKG